jgi:hypothetical protein
LLIILLLEDLFCHINEEIPFPRVPTHKKFRKKQTLPTKTRMTLAHAAPGGGDYMSGRISVAQNAFRIFASLHGLDRFAQDRPEHQHAAV